MKLSEISKAPKLVEILLDDEETVKEFGEPLSFHTWDRQPMELFIKLANLSDGSEKNVKVGDMINVVKTLVLDDKGKEIITDKSALPSHVLMKVIQKVSESLGK